MILPTINQTKLNTMSQVVYYCRLFFEDFFNSVFFNNRSGNDTCYPDINFYKDVTLSLLSPKKHTVYMFYLYFLLPSVNNFRIFWKQKKIGKRLMVYCLLLLPMVINKTYTRNICIGFNYSYLYQSLVLLMNWVDLYRYNVVSAGLLIDLQRYPFFLFFKYFFTDIFFYKYKPLSIGISLSDSKYSYKYSFFYSFFQMPFYKL